MATIELDERPTMIISVHHYELGESAQPSDFHEAVDEAVSRNLFEGIPGLIDYRIVQGIRGNRTGKFAAIWTYESQEAWTNVWGAVSDPISKSEYPDEWLIWEDELLEPILAGDPDEIEYTSYQIVAERDVE